MLLKCSDEICMRAQNKINNIFLYINFLNFKLCYLKLAYTNTSFFYKVVGNTHLKKKQSE